MEEPRAEDNKALPEKNKGRQLKTAAQIEALEKLYNEHKYPPESMKLQLAASVKLTEKQISGWFCHRRLKDKKLSVGETTHATGRQDHSSGIVHDNGSGLRQDSCGSTKQSDQRHINPREVESRRLWDTIESSDEEVTHGHGSFHNENYCGTDDTSSESSSPLQKRFISHNEDAFSVMPKKHQMLNTNSVPTYLKDVNKRKGPSGYLKVKVKGENAAITTVKRQLGNQYRDDGPPLGVEFQPLPPGAFESSTRDLKNEPCFSNDPVMAPYIPRTHKRPNSGTRYDVHSAKMTSYEIRPTNMKLKHGGPLEMENRSSRRIPEDDILYRERRAAIGDYFNNPVSMKSRPTNEMRAASRVRSEFSQKQHPEKTPPWTNQIRRSAQEIPPGFSDDETAEETSSSMDL